MNLFIENFRRYALIRAVLYIVFGALALLNPGSLFRWLVIIISAYIAFLGILDLIAAFRLKKHTQTLGPEFTKGWLLILLAAIIFFFAKGIMGLLPFFLGLTIVVNGIYQLVNAINGRQIGISGMGWILYSIFIMIVGIVLLFNPFGSLLVLFQIFGAVLIVMGIVQIINYIQLRRM